MHFHVDLYTLAKLLLEFQTKYSPKLNSIHNETQSPQQKGPLPDWYTRWGLVNLDKVASSKPIRTFAHCVQVRKLSPSLEAPEKYRRSRSKGIQLKKPVGGTLSSLERYSSAYSSRSKKGVDNDSFRLDVEMRVGILKLQGVVVEAVVMEVKAEHSSTGRVEHIIQEDTEDGRHVGAGVALQSICRLRQWYELQSRVILLIGKQRIDVRIDLGIGGKRKFHDQHSDGELRPCLQEELRCSDCRNKVTHPREWIENQLNI
nr:hypothetical protein Iba_chr14eCG8670 [Ipomoea batatas]